MLYQCQTIQHEGQSNLARCQVLARQYFVTFTTIDTHFTVHLQKFANKEYTRLTGKKVKKSSDHDENGEDGEGDDDKKKNKPPNMNRLLKTRLQKLVEKTDEET